ncbi:MAG: Ig-like domain-containing protein [Spirochaetes bacterium]|nr:Ig-like domain-containing protein [Spirochaetota bacterium]
MIKSKLVISSLLAVLLVSCGNIMHDLQQQITLSLPLLPHIEYTFPQQGAESVFIDSKILVFFNREMDTATIYDDSFQVEKTNGGGTVIVRAEAIDTASGSCRMVLLRLLDGLDNEIEFDPESEYRVTLQHEIMDMYNRKIKPGYEWSFLTGLERDDESPIIDYCIPARNSCVDYQRPLIWARFSEDVIPDAARWEERFSVVKHGTAVQEPGSYSYRIEKNPMGVYECRIEFRPDNDLEKDSLYDVTISGFTDLAGNEMHVFESSFRTGAVRVELEEPQNYYEGFGTFGDKTLDQGYMLRTDDALPLVGFIDYDQSMNNFFDRSNGGPFAAGRYIRIVHKGVNIIDMGLAPFAKMIDGPVPGAPGKMEVYIDHVFGRFILPRPEYWSRMESEADVLNPVIGDGTTEFQQEANYRVYYDPGKWGKCLWLHSSSRFAGTNYLYPFGSGHVVNTGTISFWTFITQASSVSLRFRIHFGGSENYILIQDDTIVLYVNGTPSQESNIDLINTGSWHHVYLVWDRDAGLAGSLRLKLLIDGGEYQLFASDYWAEGGLYLAFYIGDTALVSADIYLDNLKIWNHVVAEDPGFEWGGGVGRENALHDIYGPDADPEYDYRPKLTGPDGGVGYYYLP